ncbi:MAG TPA: nucleotidyltransferase family protein [Steroidobacteraceae bacterium]|jgi:NDP-sugar pyrophosphorylase family protein|nr:nucleotidyltransferase family protein [Steroidobacteraceae bacterium]
MLPLAILAGGLATRLGPVTSRTPKSLIAVAGRPFIYHQLELLRSQGIDRVVLCVGHLADQIRASVGDGNGLGLTIRYSYDGDRLLGTGGAIKKALPLLGTDFFVLNGDSYLPCSLAQIQSAYRSAGRPGLMTLVRNDNRWDRSNIVYRGGEIVEYDKHSIRADMAHIDFGLSVFSKDVFAKYQPARSIDLADICRELVTSGQLAAFEVSGRFYEIGSQQGIIETQEFLSRRPANA